MLGTAFGGLAVYFLLCGLLELDAACLVEFDPQLFGETCEVLLDMGFVRVNRVLDLINGFLHVFLLGDDCLAKFPECAGVWDGLLLDDIKGLWLDSDFRLLPEGSLTGFLDLPQFLP